MTRAHEDGEVESTAQVAETGDDVPQVDDAAEHGAESEI
jgi:hypothetical protein